MSEGSPAPAPSALPPPPPAWTGGQEHETATHLATGSRVCITGLPYRTDLNGSHAVVLSAKDEEDAALLALDGRVRVKPYRAQMPGDMLCVRTTQVHLVSVSLEMLPPEMLAVIASHLTSSTACGRFECVCRALRDAVKGNAHADLVAPLWRRLSFDEFPRLASIMMKSGVRASDVRWKDVYANQRAADTALPLVTRPRKPRPSLADFVCTVEIEFIGDTRKKKRGPRRPRAADIDGPRRSSWSAPFSDVFVADEIGEPYLQVNGAVWRPTERPEWARFLDGWGSVGWRLLKYSVYATHRMSTVKLAEGQNFLHRGRNGGVGGFGYFGPDDDNDYQRLAYQFDEPNGLFMECQLLFDSETGAAELAFMLESESDPDSTNILTKDRLLHYLAQNVPWAREAFLSAVDSSLN
jgi:hypothetical protein